MRGLPTVTDAGKAADVRRQRVQIVVGLAALVVVAASFLALGSAVVPFGVAVAAAFVWCFWLERQPEEAVGAAHATDHRDRASSNGEKSVLVEISPVVSRQVQIARQAGSVGSLRGRGTVGCRIAIITIGAIAAIGCDTNSALERLSQARHISADLLVQFTKAADAANKAVMADTDEASVAFAREAEQAKQAIQKDTDALAPILQSLGYSDETAVATVREIQVRQAPHIAEADDAVMTRMEKGMATSEAAARSALRHSRPSSNLRPARGSPRPPPL